MSLPHKAASLQLLETTFSSLTERIALAGLASTREAAAAIHRGEVQVNGVVATENVQANDKTHVTFQGLEVPANTSSFLWALYKPKYVKCTLDSGHGDTTTLRSHIRASSEEHEQREGKFPLFLPSHMHIVTPLRFQDEGLVLLTNDAAFGRTLSDPRSKVQSVYRVKVFGTPPGDLLRSIWRGVEVDGIDYGPVWVEPLRRNFRTSWFRIRYVERAECPLQRLLESFRLKILTSERYAFGPITLKELPDGVEFTQLSIPKAFLPFLPARPKNFHIVPAHGCSDKGDIYSIFQTLQRQSAIAKDRNTS